MHVMVGVVCLLSQFFPLVKVDPVPEVGPELSLAEDLEQGVVHLGPVSLSGLAEPAHEAGLAEVALNAVHLEPTQAKGLLQNLQCELA